MTAQRRFRRKQSKISKYFEVVIGIFALVGFMLPGIQNVFAVGTLTTPRDYLNHQQYNEASGIQHEVFFTATTAVSGGSGANKIILTFPLGDNAKWCRTVGTDLLVAGITNATGVPVGSTENATLLPGSTLLGACTQGNGSSTFDTITITGVDNLTAGVKYGVRIGQKASSPTALLGTATGTPPLNNIQMTIKTNNGTADVDSAVAALSLIASDQVAVSATITPTLSVSYDTTTAALGTLDTTHVNQAGIVQTVTTNAGNGYISLVKYSGTFAAGGNTLADAGGSIAVGASKFGVSTSQTGPWTISTWNPTSCATTTSTTTASSLTTSYQDYAASPTAVSAQAATLCFAASASGTQAAGVYTTTVTLITTARF